MIDVKKLLYKYPKLIVALGNIQSSITRLSKQYPSCTPQYSADIQGRGGLPSSQTERFAFGNVVDIEEKRQWMEWDVEEHQYAINLVKSALETLDNRQRECIKLCYFEGREPVSAAMAMNISTSRFYHIHGTAIAGIEQCLNGGNIFLNRLIPIKNNKKRNKNTVIQTVKTAV